MFPHSNICKYIWTSPDGETHDQPDHVLIDKIRHLSTVEVQSFRGTNYDTITWWMKKRETDSN